MYPEVQFRAEMLKSYQAALVDLRLYGCDVLPSWTGGQMQTISDVTANYGVRSWCQAPGPKLSDAGLSRV